MQRRNNSVPQAGFSLLEVLIAFVILVLTLTALLQGYGTSVRHAAAAEQYLKASTIASSLIAAVGREVSIEESDARGAIDDTFGWRRVIRRLPDIVEDGVTTPVVNAYRIDLSVNWGYRGRERHYTLTTIRLVQPPPDLNQ